MATLGPLPLGVDKASSASVARTCFAGPRLFLPAGNLLSLPYCLDTASSLEAHVAAELHGRRGLTLDRVGLPAEENARI
jgi:hypothetical protein